MKAQIPSNLKAPKISSKPKAKKGEPLERHGTVSGSPGQIAEYANRWRENYNPLRGLSMAIAVSLLERGQRGDMALLQWTFRFIERRFPTLSALISRCEAPLVNFDWDVKVKPELPPGATQAMAKAQKQTLKDAYDGIDNLRDAITFLALADFRGYSHLQKHYSGDGDVMHLETLHQWCICRDGIYGDWFWNPDSRSMTAPVLVVGEKNRIGGAALPAQDFIIRTVERPVNEIALTNFLRQNLAEKDWDGFLEIYGLPGGVVTMPGNVPTGKESVYETMAQRVAEGGSGAIPNGSEYKPNDGPRGVDPFTPRLKHLDEQLIMVGTGGLLTMLAQSGSGTLAGNAHADTFQAIAQARALQISECFQRQFDAGVLADQHPGEPCLVYFELAAKDETDVAALVKDIVALFAAGKEADVEWLNEKTGYVLKDVEGGGGQTLEEADALKEENAELGPKNQPIANQTKLGNGKKIFNASAPGPTPAFIGRVSDDVSAAASNDLNLINKKLAALAQIADPDLLRSRAQEILNWISANEEHLKNNPALEQAIHRGMAAAFLNGVAVKT